MDFLVDVAKQARVFFLFSLFTAPYAAASQSNDHIIFYSGSNRWHNT
jgi:hypothetical protein